MWTMENPKALLRTRDFMENFNHLRSTVYYCMWGMDYKKATDIWISINGQRGEIQHNPKCNHKKHTEFAQKGSKQGHTTRNKTTTELGAIPQKLLLELFERTR